MRLTAVLLLAGMLAAAAPPAVAVEQGVEAWIRGDFAGAVRAWRPLAEAGNADAQFNIGQAYKLGRGVSADPKIARDWFEKAAEQEHEGAQANLGLLLFQSGEHKAAMPWIKMAADRGDARAQYLLGTAHFNGDFAEKDWPRAYALMTRAAAQGLGPAAESLRRMDGFIAPVDREKGAVMAIQMEEAEPSTSKAPLPASPAAAIPIASATSQSAPTGGWLIQLGAYNSPAVAQARWRAISSRIPSFADARASFEPFREYTRLRVGPYENRNAANRACAAAKSAGQDCFTVAP